MVTKVIFANKSKSLSMLPDPFGNFLADTD